MNEDIKPINDKNQAHGYWEQYYYWGGNLMYKCIFINGNEIGFEEFYNYGGKLTEKNYHL